MPDQTLTNPGGALGGAVATGYNISYFVNGSTSAIDINEVVVATSSSGPNQQVVEAPASLNNRGVLGVLDAAAVASGICAVVTDGFHLVKVSTGAIPVYGDLLVTTSSATGIVKASTASTADEAGIHIGICMSSTPDTTYTNAVLAYIKKM